jgi:non-reducing end alpha-L-arabinofuranosidase
MTKAQSPVFALALALGVVSAACASSGTGGQSDTGGSSSGGSSGGGGSGGSPGSGGSSSSGGSNATGGSSSSGGSTGSGGGTASCSNVSACGGNVVGTWTVTSSCLNVSGNLDASSLGLGCKSIPVAGSLQVTGTWTANSDGTYADNTTTTGNEQLSVPAACLQISGTSTTCDGIIGPLQATGYASLSCTNAAGGGCTCAGTVQQSDWAGIVSYSASSNGSYATASNVLTLDSGITVDTALYSYCVSSGKMTWTPQSTSPTLTGTIVLQSGATTGTGGTTGSGGAVTTGGTTGTGGAGTGGAKGGTTGSGGAVTTGGTTGTGGAKGGTSGAGGATSTGGTTGTGGSVTTGGSTGTRSQGPCDIYGTATPCAAAYSTVRALSMTYTGPLYQVRSGSSAMNTGSGGTTKDIGMTADGFADTATQDTFCSGSTCTFSLLYDQSGNGNNLKVAPAGSSNGGTYAGMADFESSATKDSLTVTGHKVYALYMNAREGYRLTAVGKGMPTGAKAQGIYELADGTHSGTACCWDFGDVSTNPLTYTTMNTIFFGTGYWGSGAGSGPWFMGDFEGGVWSDGASTPDMNSNDPSMKYQFAFGIVKTAPPSSMSIRVGNGNLPTASGLTTAFSGTNAAKTWNNSGGILIGIGSDNSNNSFGTFYEGAITNGEPADATDASILANVQAAGYGK